MNSIRNTFAATTAFRRAAWLVLLSFLLSACTVTLISQYDEVTDKSVTALQRKVEQHLVSLESVAGTPDCPYAKYQKFYEEAKVDVSAIRTRAEATPKNEITVEQIGLLGSSLGDLEQLHQLGCISKNQIPPLRIPLNTTFTAILKLELAKKSGR